MKYLTNVKNYETFFGNFNLLFKWQLHVTITSDFMNESKRDP